MAAYIILGINTEGKKEVLSINIGDNESAKYWLSGLNELKNRGVTVTIRNWAQVFGELSIMYEGRLPD